MKNVFAILIAVMFSSIAADAVQAQWVRQNSGTDAMLSDVVMLDTATAIAVGKNGSLLLTTNSGASWFDAAAHLSFIRPWSSVSFWDASNGVVAGDHGVVLTTTTGGKHWIWRQIPGGPNCLSAFYVGPGSIYVGDDSGWVYSTLDTGRTWNAEKISTWPIRSLFSYRGPTVLGIPIYALTAHSLCTHFSLFAPAALTSLSWVEKILQEFLGLGSEAFDAEFSNGGGPEFIVGVQGDLRAAPVILRKSLSDTAWNRAATGVLRDGTFLGVSAPSARVIYVCGTIGMIYKSSNGGDTWQDQTVNGARNVNAVFFFDETHGFAVGDSGMILHTSTGGITGVADREDLQPEKIVLEQNFPNPFGPATTIKYTIPAGTHGRTSLRVYDLLGRKMATLVNEAKEPGTYTHRWNAAGLSNGVYFYRVQAGWYTETKKMRVLK